MTCDSCRFACERGEKNTVLCRRFPAFQVRMRTDWCGEYVQKEKKEQRNDSPAVEPASHAAGVLLSETTTGTGPAAKRPKSRGVSNKR